MGEFDLPPFLKIQLSLYPILTRRFLFIFMKNSLGCLLLMLLIFIPACTSVPRSGHLVYTYTSVHEYCCGRYLGTIVNQYDPNRFYYQSADLYR